MNYEKYRYIFPPRPKNAVPVTELDYYESRGKYLAQPKGNGSNSVISVSYTHLTLPTNREV